MTCFRQRQREEAADDGERPEDDEWQLVAVCAEVHLLQVGDVRVDDAAEPARERRQAGASVPEARQDNWCQRSV